MINKLLTDQIITNCHPAVKFQSSQQVHEKQKPQSTSKRTLRVQQTWPTCTSYYNYEHVDLKSAAYN